MNKMSMENATEPPIPISTISTPISTRLVPLTPLITTDLCPEEGSGLVKDTTSTPTTKVSISKAIRDTSRNSDSGKSSSCSPTLLDCSFDSGIAGVLLDANDMQRHKRIQQCQRILLALERDREHFCAIRNRLSKISERKKKKIVETEFLCNVCCAEIDPENAKTFVKCFICQKYICRSIKCADWLAKTAQWECELCQTSKESLAQTSSWVADQLSFNQQKLVYPMRARSEIFIPISECNDSSIHFESVSQIGANAALITAEQKLKIREYVEEIVSRLLGGNLDTISVNQLSRSENYLPAPKTNGHHYPNGSIVSRHDNGGIGGIGGAALNSRESTPGPDFTDVSEARLRNMIQKIIAETVNMTPLTKSYAVSEIALDRPSKLTENMGFTNNGLRHRTEHYFEPTIYQDLLATAVLNKIVDKQSNNNNRNMSESSPDLTRRVEVEDGLGDGGSTALDQNYNIENQSITSGSSVEPRSECSFTDTEPIVNANEDKSSEFVLDAGRDSALSDYIAAHMVPLPNLSTMATESEEDDYMSVTSSAVGDSTWENNWLFKKKKSTVSGSLGGSSVGMLVPDPKEDVRAQIGDKTADEISDLSELGSDTDESSLDLLRSNVDPINDRLFNKHLIGGQNSKLVLDELIERSSMISNTLPTDHEQLYTETRNENVGAPNRTEAINSSVTQQSNNNNEEDQKNLEAIMPPVGFDDSSSNPLTASDDFDSNSEGCVGFGQVEVIEPTKRTPSVIEILAAIALGPMIAIPAADDEPAPLTTNELTTLNELRDLALTEIKTRSLELTSHSLGVIPEEMGETELKNVLEMEMEELSPPDPLKVVTDIEVTENISEPADAVQEEVIELKDAEPTIPSEPELGKSDSQGQKLETAVDQEIVDTIPAIEQEFTPAPTEEEASKPYVGIPEVVPTSDDTVTDKIVESAAIAEPTVPGLTEQVIDAEPAVEDTIKTNMGIPDVAPIFDEASDQASHEPVLEKPADMSEVSIKSDANAGSQQNLTLEEECTATEGISVSDQPEKHSIVAPPAIGTNVKATISNQETTVVNSDIETTVSSTEPKTPESTVAVEQLVQSAPEQNGAGETAAAQIIATTSQPTSELSDSKTREESVLCPTEQVTSEINTQVPEESPSSDVANKTIQPTADETNINISVINTEVEICERQGSEATVSLGMFTDQKQASLSTHTTIITSETSKPVEEIFEPNQAVETSTGTISKTVSTVDLSIDPSSDSCPETKSETINTPLPISVAAEVATELADKEHTQKEIQDKYTKSGATELQETLVPSIPTVHLQTEPTEEATSVVIAAIGTTKEPESKEEKTTTPALSQTPINENESEAEQSPMTPFGPLEALPATIDNAETIPSSTVQTLEESGDASIVSEIILAPLSIEVLTDPTLELPPPIDEDSTVDFTPPPPPENFAEGLSSVSTITSGAEEITNDAVSITVESHLEYKATDHLSKSEPVTNISQPPVDVVPSEAILESTKQHIKPTEQIPEPVSESGSTAETEICVESVVSPPEELPTAIIEAIPPPLETSVETDTDLPATLALSNPNNPSHSEPTEEATCVIIATIETTEEPESKEDNSTNSALSVVVTQTPMNKTQSEAEPTAIPPLGGLEALPASIDDAQTILSSTVQTQEESVDSSIVSETILATLSINVPTDDVSSELPPPIDEDSTVDFTSPPPENFAEVLSSVSTITSGAKEITNDAVSITPESHLESKAKDKVINSEAVTDISQPLVGVDPTERILESANQINKLPEQMPEPVSESGSAATTEICVESTSPKENLPTDIIETLPPPPETSTETKTDTDLLAPLIPSFPNDHLQPEPTEEARSVIIAAIETRKEPESKKEKTTTSALSVVVPQTPINGNAPEAEQPLLGALETLPSSIDDAQTILSATVQTQQESADASKVSESIHAPLSPAVPSDVSLELPPSINNNLSVGFSPPPPGKFAEVLSDVSTIASGVEKITNHTISTIVDSNFESKVSDNVLHSVAVANISQPPVGVVPAEANKESTKQINEQSEQIPEPVSVSGSTTPPENRHTDIRETISPPLETSEETKSDATELPTTLAPSLPTDTLQPKPTQETTSGILATIATTEEPESKEDKTTTPALSVVVTETPKNENESEAEQTPIHPLGALPASIDDAQTVLSSTVQTLEESGDASIVSETIVAPLSIEVLTDPTLELPLPIDEDSSVDFTPQPPENFAEVLTSVSTITSDMGELANDTVSITVNSHLESMVTENVFNSEAVSDISQPPVGVVPTETILESTKQINKPSEQMTEPVSESGSATGTEICIESVVSPPENVNTDIIETIPPPLETSVENKCDATELPTKLAPSVPTDPSQPEPTEDAKSVIIATIEATEGPESKEEKTTSPELSVVGTQNETKSEADQPPIPTLAELVITEILPETFNEDHTEALGALSGSIDNAQTTLFATVQPQQEPSIVSESIHAPLSIVVPSDVSLELPQPNHEDSNVDFIPPPPENFAEVLSSSTQELTNDTVSIIVESHLESKATDNVLHSEVVADISQPPVGVVPSEAISECTKQINKPSEQIPEPETESGSSAVQDIVSTVSPPEDFPTDTTETIPPPPLETCVKPIEEPTTQPHPETCSDLLAESSPQVAETFVPREIISIPPPDLSIDVSVPTQNSPVEAADVDIELLPPPPGENFEGSVLITTEDIEILPPTPLQSIGDSMLLSAEISEPIFSSVELPVNGTEGMSPPPGALSIGSTETTPDLVIKCSDDSQLHTDNVNTETLLPPPEETYQHSVLTTTEDNIGPITPSVVEIVDKTKSSSEITEIKTAAVVEPIPPTSAVSALNDVPSADAPLEESPPSGMLPENDKATIPLSSESSVDSLFQAENNSIQLLPQSPAEISYNSVLTAAVESIPPPQENLITENVIESTSPTNSSAQVTETVEGLDIDPIPPPPVESVVDGVDIKQTSSLQSVEATTTLFKPGTVTEPIPPPSVEFFPLPKNNIECTDDFLLPEARHSSDVPLFVTEVAIPPITPIIECTVPPLTMQEQINAESYTESVVSEPLSRTSYDEPPSEMCGSLCTNKDHAVEHCPSPIIDDSEESSVQVTELVTDAIQVSNTAKASSAQELETNDSAIRDIITVQKDGDFVEQSVSIQGRQESLKTEIETETEITLQDTKSTELIEPSSVVMTAVSETQLINPDVSRDLLPADETSAETHVSTQDIPLCEITSTPELCSSNVSLKSEEVEVPALPPIEFSVESTNETAEDIETQSIPATIPALTADSEDTLDSTEVPEPNQVEESIMTSSYPATDSEMAPDKTATVLTKSASIGPGDESVTIETSSTLAPRKNVAPASSKDICTENPVKSSDVVMDISANDVATVAETGPISAERCDALRPDAVLLDPKVDSVCEPTEDKTTVIDTGEKEELITIAAVSDKDRNTEILIDSVRTQHEVPAPHENLDIGDREIQSIVSEVIESSSPNPDTTTQTASIPEQESDNIGNVDSKTIHALAEEDESENESIFLTPPQIFSSVSDNLEALSVLEGLEIKYTSDIELSGIADSAVYQILVVSFHNEQATDTEVIPVSEPVAELTEESVKTELGNEPAEHMAYPAADTELLEIKAPAPSNDIVKSVDSTTELASAITPSTETVTEIYILSEDSASMKSSTEEREENALKMEIVASSSVPETDVAKEPVDSQNVLIPTESCSTFQSELPTTDVVDALSHAEISTPDTVPNTAPVSMQVPSEEIKSLTNVEVTTLPAELVCVSDASSKEITQLKPDQAIAPTVKAPADETPADPDTETTLPTTELVTAVKISSDVASSEISAIIEQPISLPSDTKTGIIDAIVAIPNSPTVLIANMEINKDTLSETDVCDATTEARASIVAHLPSEELTVTSIATESVSVCAELPDAAVTDEVREPIAVIQTETSLASDAEVLGTTQSIASSIIRESTVASEETKDISTNLDADISTPEYTSSPAGSAVAIETTTCEVFESATQHEKVLAPDLACTVKIHTKVQSVEFELSSSSAEAVATQVHNSTMEISSIQSTEMTSCSVTDTPLTDTSIVPKNDIIPPPAQFSFDESGEPYTVNLNTPSGTTETNNNEVLDEPMVNSVESAADICIVPAIISAINTTCADSVPADDGTKISLDNYGTNSSAHLSDVGEPTIVPEITKTLMKSNTDPSTSVEELLPTTTTEPDPDCTASIVDTDVTANVSTDTASENYNVANTDTGDSLESSTLVESEASTLPAAVESTAEQETSSPVAEKAADVTITEPPTNEQIISAPPPETAEIKSSTPEELSSAKVCPSETDPVSEDAIGTTEPKSLELIVEKEQTDLADGQLAAQATSISAENPVEATKRESPTNENIVSTTQSDATELKSSTQEVVEELSSATAEKSVPVPVSEDTSGIIETISSEIILKKSQIYLADEPAVPQETSSVITDNLAEATEAPTNVIKISATQSEAAEMRSPVETEEPPIDKVEPSETADVSEDIEIIEVKGQSDAQETFSKAADDTSKTNITESPTNPITVSDTTSEAAEIESSNPELPAELPIAKVDPSGSVLISEDINGTINPQSLEITVEKEQTCLEEEQPAARETSFVQATNSEEVTDIPTNVISGLDRQSEAAEIQSNIPELIEETAAARKEICETVHGLEDTTSTTEALSPEIIAEHENPDVAEQTVAQETPSVITVTEIPANIKTGSDTQPEATEIKHSTSEITEESPAAKEELCKTVPESDGTSGVSLPSEIIEEKEQAKLAEKQPAAQQTCSIVEDRNTESTLIESSTNATQPEVTESKFSIPQETQEPPAAKVESNEAYPVTENATGTIEPSEIVVEQQQKDLADDHHAAPETTSTEEDQSAELTTTEIPIKLGISCDTQNEATEIKSCTRELAGESPTAKQSCATDPLHEDQTVPLDTLSSETVVEIKQIDIPEKSGGNLNGSVPELFEPADESAKTSATSEVISPISAVSLTETTSTSEAPATNEPILSDGTLMTDSKPLSAGAKCTVNSAADISIESLTNVITVSETISEEVSNKIEDSTATIEPLASEITVNVEQPELPKESPAAQETSSNIADDCDEITITESPNKAITAETHAEITNMRTSTPELEVVTEVGSAEVDVSENHAGTIEPLSSKIAVEKEDTDLSAVHETPSAIAPINTITAAEPQPETANVSISSNLGVESAETIQVSENPGKVMEPLPSEITVEIGQTVSAPNLSEHVDPPAQLEIVSTNSSIELLSTTLVDKVLPADSASSATKITNEVISTNEPIQSDDASESQQKELKEPTTGSISSSTEAPCTVSESPTETQETIINTAADIITESTELPETLIPSPQITSIDSETKERLSAVTTESPTAEETCSIIAGTTITEDQVVVSEIQPNTESTKSMTPELTEESSTTEQVQSDDSAGKISSKIVVKMEKTNLHVDSTDAHETSSNVADNFAGVLTVLETQPEIAAITCTSELAKESLAAETGPESQGPTGTIDSIDAENSSDVTITEAPTNGTTVLETQPDAAEIKICSPNSAEESSAVDTVTVSGDTTHASSSGTEKTQTIVTDCVAETFETLEVAPVPPEEIIKTETGNSTEVPPSTTSTNEVDLTSESVQSGETLEPQHAEIKEQTVESKSKSTDEELIVPENASTHPTVEIQPQQPECSVGISDSPKVATEITPSEIITELAVDIKDVTKPTKIAIDLSLSEVSVSSEPDIINTEQLPQETIDSVIPQDITCEDSEANILIVNITDSAIIEPVSDVPIVTDAASNGVTTNQTSDIDSSEKVFEPNASEPKTTETPTTSVAEAVPMCIAGPSNVGDAVKNTSEINIETCAETKCNIFQPTESESEAALTELNRVFTFKETYVDNIHNVEPIAVDTNDIKGADLAAVLITTETASSHTPDTNKPMGSSLEVNVVSDVVTSISSAENITSLVPTSEPKQTTVDNDLSPETSAISEPTTSLVTAEQVIEPLSKNSETKTTENPNSKLLETISDSITVSTSTHVQVIAEDPVANTNESHSTVVPKTEIVDADSSASVIDAATTNESTKETLPANTDEETLHIAVAGDAAAEVSNESTVYSLDQPDIMSTKTCPASPTVEPATDNVKIPSESSAEICAESIVAKISVDATAETITLSAETCTKMTPPASVLQDSTNQLTKVLDTSTDVSHISENPEPSAESSAALATISTGASTTLQELAKHLELPQYPCIEIPEESASNSFALPEATDSHSEPTASVTIPAHTTSGSNACNEVVTTHSCSDESITVHDSLEQQLNTNSNGVPATVSDSVSVEQLPTISSQVSCEILSIPTAPATNQSTESSPLASEPTTEITPITSPPPPSINTSKSSISNGSIVEDSAIPPAGASADIPTKVNTEVMEVLKSATEVSSEVPTSNLTQNVTSESNVESELPLSALSDGKMTVPVTSTGTPQTIEPTEPISDPEAHACPGHNSITEENMAQPNKQETISPTELSVIAETVHVTSAIEDSGVSVVESSIEQLTHVDTKACEVPPQIEIVAVTVPSTPLQLEVQVSQGSVETTVPKITSECNQPLKTSIGISEITTSAVDIIRVSELSQVTETTTSIESIQEVRAKDSKHSPEIVQISPSTDGSHISQSESEAELSHEPTSSIAEHPPTAAEQHLSVDTIPVTDIREVSEPVSNIEPLQEPTTKDSEHSLETVQISPSSEKPREPTIVASENFPMAAELSSITDDENLVCATTDTTEETKVECIAEQPPQPEFQPTAEEVPAHNENPPTETTEDSMVPVLEMLPGSVSLAEELAAAMKANSTEIPLTTLDTLPTEIDTATISAVTEELIVVHSAPIDQKSQTSPQNISDYKELNISPTTEHASEITIVEASAIEPSINIAPADLVLSEMPNKTSEPEKSQICPTSTATGTESTSQPETSTEPINTTVPTETSTVITETIVSEEVSGSSASQQNDINTPTEIPITVVTITTLGESSTPVPEVTESSTSNQTNIIPSSEIPVTLVTITAVDVPSTTVPVPNDSGAEPNFILNEPKITAELVNEASNESSTPDTVPNASSEVTAFSESQQTGIKPATETPMNVVTITALGISSTPVPVSNVSEEENSSNPPTEIPATIEAMTPPEPDNGKDIVAQDAQRNILKLETIAFQPNQDASNDLDVSVDDESSLILSNQSTMVEVENPYEVTDSATEMDSASGITDETTTIQPLGNHSNLRKLTRQYGLEYTTPSFEDASQQQSSSTSPPPTPPRNSTNSLADLCQKYINDKHLLAALESRRRQTLLMHRFLSTIDSFHSSDGDSVEDTETHTEVLLHPITKKRAQVVVPPASVSESCSSRTCSSSSPSITPPPVDTVQSRHDHSSSDCEDCSSDSRSFKVIERCQISYNFINKILFSDQISTNNISHNDDFSRVSTIEEIIDNDQDTNTDDEKDFIVDKKKMKKLRRTTTISTTSTSTSTSTTNNTAATCSNKLTRVKNVKDNALAASSHKRTNPKHLTNTTTTNNKDVSLTLASTLERTKHTETCVSSNNVAQHVANGYVANKDIGENYYDDSDVSQNEEEEDDELGNLCRFVPGSIAEREYKKWYNAVEMPNNPYAPEALKRRISGSQERFIDLPNISPSTEQSPLDMITKDKLGTDDSDKRESEFRRYSRDYYINDGSKSPQVMPMDQDTAKDATETTEQQLEPEVEHSSSSASQHKTQTETATETVLDLYTAIPARVVEDTASSLDTISQQSMQSASTATSDDSDTIKIYNFKKQETTVIKDTKEKPNEQTAGDDVGTSTQTSAATTKERPMELSLNRTESVSGAAKVTTPTRGPTPVAFKFLQPKRKLLDPSQVMSVDEDEPQIPTGSTEKPVIEKEVVKALPSVKALAKAFLMTSSSVQYSSKKISWPRKAKTLPEGEKVPFKPGTYLEPACTAEDKSEEDATIASDLSSLETDSLSVTKQQTENTKDQTPQSSTPATTPPTATATSPVDTPGSPVPVRQGVLKSNIAFFENLKNSK